MFEIIYMVGLIISLYSLGIYFWNSKDEMEKEVVSEILAIICLGSLFWPFLLIAWVLSQIGSWFFKKIKNILKKS